MSDHPKTDDRSEEPKQFQFIIQPSGHVVRSASDQTYAAALSRGDLPISTECGFMGTCGKCKIRFVSAAPAPSAAGMRRLSKTELSEGWRLACQHAVRSDAAIEIAELKRAPQTAERPVDREDVPQSGIEGFEIRFAPRAQPDAQDCAQTVSKALGEVVRCSKQARQAFTDNSADRTVALFGVRRGDQILQLDPISRNTKLLGLAIDVGTTTLAVQLYNLASGDLIASEAAYNPQRAWGADVISRIGHVRAHRDEGLKQLQQSVVRELNTLIEDAVEISGGEANHIFRTVVAGNPTMLHLFAGVSPVGIDLSPYTPVFLDSRVYAPVQLGLRGHPAGEVILLPGISSYIGADIVAGMMATALGGFNERELLVDIGTNGEIVLYADGRYLACSTAAGPAFEGAAIRDGVGAIPGAIDDVEIRANEIRCKTIHGKSAIGICGTGLLAAVHELRKSGLIDSSGRLLPGDGSLAARCSGVGADAHVVLESAAEQVSIYQKDIRALQLGKAAIRAGIDTLLAAADLAPSDLQAVYVAGAFGTFLAPARAIGIGLLPEIAVERIRAVGNTSAQGASMVLLNETRKKNADSIAEKVGYIELATDPDFTKRFLARMAFP